MSDAEAVIREALPRCSVWWRVVVGCGECENCKALAALDVLVVEKDTFRQVAAHHRERVVVLEAALTEALAEIDGSPYAMEPWGWGIAYRIKGWRAALSAGCVPDATDVGTQCGSQYPDGCSNPHCAIHGDGCVPACKRCNDSGVVASVDGEAMDCQDCEAGCVPKETPDE